jgi:hypothetical protein
MWAQIILDKVADTKKGERFEVVYIEANTRNVYRRTTTSRELTEDEVRQFFQAAKSRKVDVDAMLQIARQRFTARARLGTAQR